MDLNSTGTAISYDSRLVDDPGARDEVDMKIVEGQYAWVKHEGAAMVPAAETSPTWPPATLTKCTFLVGYARCNGDLVVGSMLLHGGNDVGRLFGNIGGYIYGGPGRDVLWGGTGDDWLYGDDDGTSNTNDYEPSADVYFGGAGEDTVSTVGAPGPVTVTLDDQANDGVAGEGDNIHSDVEEVAADGNEFENLLIGNDLANRLSGWGEVIGRGGADRLTGSFNEDVLEGGPGEDEIVAAAGEDVIRADDGETDVIDCGEGRDTVEADAIDQLTACEIVELP